MAPLAWEANSKLAEFDIAARVRSIDELYDDMKIQMAGSDFERTHQKEMIDMMKARSKYYMAMPDYWILAMEYPPRVFAPSSTNQQSQLGKAL